MPKIPSMTLGRRGLLLGAAAGLATPALATSTAIQEAPSLAKLVAAGQLPPLARRLPDEPMVVHPFKTPGSYGGTWRLSMASASDIGSLARTIGYENLTRWKTWSPDVKQADILPDVEMNVAQSVDITEDGKVYTFRLRKGLRWSDGHPYTADDVMFWYEDVYSDDQLMPGKPAWSVRGGKPLVVEKIDDYTIAFRFAAPNGLLLQWLAKPAYDPEPNVPTAYPRHYLSQFHRKYNKDTEATARAAGAQSWVTWFHSKADAWRNPEVPRLNPWIVTTGIGQGNGSRVIAHRNPYYFKVDTAGNQLPYIDDVTVDIVTDAQVMLLKAANGDFDMVDSYIGFVTTPENKSVLSDNEKRGNYSFYEVLPNRANLMIVSLNLVAKDPRKRAFLADKAFRQALSVAIDRKELISLVWLDQGRPYQVVERPESPLFDEKMATQFTKFDPTIANAMLDKAGYTKKNSDGIRLDQSGEPIQITIDISVLRQPWIDAGQLIKGYWRAVGVELFVNTMDTNALFQRVQNNDHEAAVWSASAGADTIFDPKYYFPSSRIAFYASTWGNWYTHTANAEEPSDAAKKQMALYDEVLASLDPAKRIALMKQLMQITVEEFYSIGIVQPTTDYGIVNNRLRNVPPVLLASTEYTHPGVANPEQFFFAAK
jgi:peptide/nickel transport system substrate-binding protein